MADKKLEILITAQDNASSTINGIGNNLSNLSKSSQNVGQAFQTVGKSIAAIGAVAAAGLGASIKAAVDWESAFAGVKKTVEASQEEFAALEKSLLSLARTIPVSAKELAGIAETAGQLGVAKEDIIAFTEVMAKLGVTTNLTSEEAATAFAQIANVMKTPIQEIDNLASALVDLGNNGASTESQILEFANRIAGAGQVAGLTATNLLSIGNAFASVGVQAEAGGTAVSKVLMNIDQAVATGSESLTTFAEVAGMSAEEFSAAWESDPASAFTSFVEGLGKSGKDAYAILEELGLQDSRLISAFLRMAGAGDLLRNSIDLGNKAFQENNALQSEAEKRFATTASQMQLFQNNMTQLGIVIGSALLPAINQLIANITPLVLKFSEFAAAHPQLVTGILMFVAALGALSAILLIIVPIFTAWATVIGVLAPALAGIGVAIAAVGAPVLILVAAVTAIVVAVGLLLNHFGLLQPLLQMVGQYFTLLWTAMTQTAVGATMLWTAMQSLMSVFMPFVSFLMQAAAAIIPFVQSLFQAATAAYQLATAQMGLDAANRAVEASTAALNRASLDLAQAELNVQRAAIQETEAIRQYGAGSLEAQQATLNHQRAQVDLKDAQDRSKAAADQHSASLQKQSAATKAVETATTAASAAAGVAQGAWNALIGVINSVAGAFNSLASAARNAANAAKGALSAGGSKFGLKFQHGGVIPGSFNDAVPAILHGGERVVSRTGTDVNSGGGSGGGNTINLIIEGDVNSMDMVNNIVNKIKESIGRDAELTSFGVGV